MQRYRFNRSVHAHVPRHGDQKHKQWNYIITEPRPQAHSQSAGNTEKLEMGLGRGYEG